MLTFLEQSLHNFDLGPNFICIDHGSGLDLRGVFVEAIWKECIRVKFMALKIISFIYSCNAAFLPPSVPARGPCGFERMEEIPARKEKVLDMESPSCIFLVGISSDLEKSPQLECAVHILKF